MRRVDIPWLACRPPCIVLYEIHRLGNGACHTFSCIPDLDGPSPFGCLVAEYLPLVDLRPPGGSAKRRHAPAAAPPVKYPHDTPIALDSCPVSAAHHQREGHAVLHSLRSLPVRRRRHITHHCLLEGDCPVSRNGVCAELPPRSVAIRVSPCGIIRQRREDRAVPQQCPVHHHPRPLAEFHDCAAFNRQLCAFFDAHPSAHHMHLPFTPYLGTEDDPCVDGYAVAVKAQHPRRGVLPVNGERMPAVLHRIAVPSGVFRPPPCRRSSIHLWPGGRIAGGRGDIGLPRHDANLAAIHIDGVAERRKERQTAAQRRQDGAKTDSSTNSSH